MIKSAAITAESEEIMNSKFKQTAKRLLSGFIATATAVTMLPEIPQWQRISDAIPTPCLRVHPPRERLRRPHRISV